MDPYDELPYRCLPVEWTAPERLALASFLHGGPRPRLDTYRVLELGCGNGANLLPQAFYRRQATFVGVDAARTQIDVADDRRSVLGLSNLEFIHANFLKADERLTGEFDFIVGHGIFSWVPLHIRDALLRLCARRLRRGGLLYLNYNTNPGWKLRGMVRDFLMAQTTGVTGLVLRAQAAQEVASKVIAALPQGDHAYSRLMADEFRFVCENHVSYVAHEYLASVNQPYWRSDFMALMTLHGFVFVADADFNYSSGRLAEDVPSRLLDEGIVGRAIEDTVDLLCYRQLHSAILTNRAFARRLPTAKELKTMFIASELTPCQPSTDGHATFQHPSGYRVEVKERAVARAFETLGPHWPRALRIEVVFPEVRAVMEDLLLLHRNGLIELRCLEASECALVAEPLATLESEYGGYVTTRYHTRTAAAR